MPAPDMKRLTTAILSAFAVAALVFGFFPGTDLAVSGWFHSADEGFRLARSGAVILLRDVLWNLSAAMALISLAALILGLIRRGPVLWLPVRVWAFNVALYALAPGIIVDGLLKRFWGRARPDQVTEFGGEDRFTPFHVITDECDRNCSFTSGEGAAAAALGVTVLVMTLHLANRLPRPAYVAGLCAAAALPILGGAVRIVMGRHFLSDTVFSILIVIAVAAILHAVLLRPRMPAE